MTNEEIDKWVEEHVTAPEDSKIRPAVVEWGKKVAHKFYDLGKEEGKKVVDYTAAFELEDKLRYEHNINNYDCEGNVPA